MLNKALFKLEWRSNYKILLIFCAILAMYITIMVSMYDPKLGSALEEFSKSMPEIMAMAGMSGATSTLVEFLATYLYGLIMIVFPFIFTLLLSLRLVVRKVDNGVMSYLLSSGVKRSRVIFTQLMVLLSNLVVLLAFATALGIISSILMFPGELEISAFLYLNFGTLLLHLALSGICFMASCVFNEYRLATLVGAGIPIYFILIQMLSNMQGSMEWLKYFTLLTLFDTNELLAGNGQVNLIILALVGFICYMIGGFVFKRKSMAL